MVFMVSGPRCVVCFSFERMQNRLCNEESRISKPCDPLNSYPHHASCGLWLMRWIQARLARLSHFGCFAALADVGDYGRSA